MKTLLLALSFALQLSGAVIVTNAPVNITPAAYYENFTAFAPEHDGVVAFNPPVFKWTYRPIETLTNRVPCCGAGTGPAAPVYRFRFEHSTNDFASTNWSLLVTNNFYNFLRPITNANGTTWLGTNYWRIAYLDRTASSVVATSGVYRFRIAADAKNWDRSMLADRTYRNSIIGQHPHMMFTATNKAAITNYLLAADDLAVNWVRNNFFAAVNYYISNPWWTTNGAAINTNTWYLPVDGNIVSAWGQLSQVTFAWHLTGNTNYYGTNAGSRLPELAEWLALETYRLGMDHQYDDYAMGMYSRPMSLCYDWLYNSMNATQRSNVLRTITAYSKFLTYQFSSIFYETNTADVSNRVFDSDYTAEDYSSMMNGDGHSRLNMAALHYMANAAAADNPELEYGLEHQLNYLIARGDPLRTDEGDGYGYAVGRGYVNYGYIMAMITFKEAGLTNIDTFERFMELQAYRHPVGYRFVMNWWGDLGGSLDIPLMHIETIGIAARVRQNGGLYRHQQRSRAFRSDSDLSPTEGGAVVFYNFPGTPTETDLATGYVNTNMGWSVASSLPPTDYGAFSNGLGMILTARPYVNTVGHATYHDAAPFFWAWGAQLTEGGWENYQKHPMINNGPFVNGVGVYHTGKSWPGQFPWHNRIIAFTNNDSEPFAVTGVDVTRSFNRGGFPVGSEIGYEYYNAHEQSQVTSVKRFVAWPQKRFWVDFVSFETTNASTFQWKWNVRLDTLVTNGPPGDFRYTVTNFWHQSNITVYVKHAQPESLRYTNLNATIGSSNWYRVNPFTGEDYQASFPDTYPTMKHNIWLWNATPSTNGHFMAVIYPRHWTNTIAPTITYRDARTACVTNTEDSIAEVVYMGASADAPADATFVFDPQSTSTAFEAPAGGSEGGGGSPAQQPTRARGQSIIIRGGRL